MADFPFNAPLPTTIAPSDQLSKVVDIGGQVFNVKAFGAKGDGATDDTAAIQAAINAASTGSDAFFPYTSLGYLCGQITVPSGVRLVFANGAKLVAPSSLAVPWIQAQQSVVHDGTAILNGTFDASATTNTGVTQVINFSGVTSCPNLRIQSNRIINAPVHGIQIGEATYTSDIKWIVGNSVEGHGIAATGYGIFPNYVGNVLVEGNYVYSTNADDAIELGRSGPAQLGGLNAHLRAVGNVCVNGQLQFPFSDYAEIIGNTVIGNTIQNDTNTANHVSVIGNTVMDATPAAGYAGIRVSGDDCLIDSNNVTVTANDGISVTSVSSGSITNNRIYSSNSIGNSGSAINDNGATSLTINGNNCDGISGNGFAYGLNLTGSFHSVTGNAFRGGCFNGYTGTVTNTEIADNFFGVYNNALAAGMGAGGIMRSNRGINPVGLQSVAVPASGTAVAATYYDRLFYVTASTSTVAVDITDAKGTSQSVATIPASGFGVVMVPASSSMTPTYTVAPTWTVFGN